MSKPKPFLGETTDRDKAFFGIASFELKVVEDPFGHHTREGGREYRFTKSNIPRYLKCANPRCQQGGLDLQQIVNFGSAGQTTLYCNGHEGSPAGRRKGDPCDNSFIVTLEKTEA
jgi:hypothetical protein